MKQLYFKTRSAWRRWLSENHAREREGIWLVFYKKVTGKTSLDYNASVEEALCFGWVDSLIKRIDDQKYCRKFTPRKDDSTWSNVNKLRVERMIKEGNMTASGLAKVEAAKHSGRWELNPQPLIDLDIPKDLSKALEQNTIAKQYFEQLAPSYRKHFIGWIVTAKRPETRNKRINESLKLLSRGKKLGLK